jgi:integrase
MANKRKKIKTKYPGVRYEERTRNGRKDQYFWIRYSLRGGEKEEGIGWASDGFTAKKASLNLARLRELNSKEGIELSCKERKGRDAMRREKEDVSSITFKQIFEDYYYPHQLESDKKPGSYERELSLFKKWICPLSQLPLKDISPFDVEKVKKQMFDAGQSPRSVKYALSVIRQVFNYSRGHGLFDGDHPIGRDKAKMPTFDNVRTRFLDHEEAKELLDALKVKDFATYEISFISLYAGLRAGEIFDLEWRDINFDRAEITLRDTKSGETSIVDMTDEIRELLSDKKKGRPGDLVFPSPLKGKKRSKVSKVYRDVVKELGFNEGITDRRQKVCFHTLRHTFASWLIEQGEDIYTVQKLLREKTLSMAIRYAHITDTKRKEAIRKLGAARRKPASKKVVSLHK